jgi:hypothetical protein
MFKFYSEIQSPEEWRAQLAHPKKNWAKGKSAYELAYAWLGANRNLPASISKLLDSREVFKNLIVDKAIVEKKVKLDAYGRPSQTDLMLYGHNKNGKIVIAIEGKESEPFDLPVSKWLMSEREGSNKKPRLAHLINLLKLSNLGDDKIAKIGYQLLHRTASALLEAKNYGAKYAMMLVHSFLGNDKEDHFKDYGYFLGLIGIEDPLVRRNKIVGPVILNGINLYFGWLRDKKRG